MQIENIVDKKIKVIDIKKANWDESDLLFDRIIIEHNGKNYILKAESCDEACLSLETY